MSIEDILYIIGNAFRIYVYWKLINSLFKIPRVSNVLIIAGCVNFFLINTSASFIFENMPNIIATSINIATNIIPMIALTFLYQAKISSKIFAAIAFYAVNMMADGIIYIICITNINAVKALILNSGIVVVMFTFILELIFEYVLRKQYLRELEKSHFIIILTVPTGSIIIGILVMYDYYSVKAIFIFLILILFNLLVFYLYESLQKNFQAAYEKRMLLQGIQAKNTQMELMKESQEKLSILRHDFKNHLICIEKYVETNDYAGVMKYIRNTFDFLKIDGQLINTGNPNIDGIINYKLQEMMRKNTDVQYSVLIPSNINVNDFDINIILGNLLDNALEATEKTENKKVSLNISFDKGMLFIHIENTYDGMLKKFNDKLYTTKSDKQLHGIGLKSVENVLSKYDGEIIFDYDNSVFKTDVLLVIRNAN